MRRLEGRRREVWRSLGIAIALPWLAGSCDHSVKTAPASPPSATQGLDAGIALKKRLGDQVAVFMNGCGLGPQEGGILFIPAAPQDSLYLRVKFGEPEAPMLWNSFPIMFRRRTILEIRTISQQTIDRAFDRKGTAGVPVDPRDEVVIALLKEGNFDLWDFEDVAGFGKMTTAPDDHGGPMPGADGCKRLIAWAHAHGGA